MISFYIRYPFEVVSAWHSQPGEINSRNNFRMLELHTFLFEFIMPWWSKANSRFEEVFPKTYSYWKVHFEDKNVPNAKLKMEQMVQGITYGYREIMKLIRKLLSPPLAFLVLVDVVEGRHFLRALLKCVTMHGIGLPHCKWSVFELQHLRDITLTTDEQKWFDLLRCDIEDTCHFFVQIGLHRPVIQDDFKKLYHSAPGIRDPSVSTPLKIFQSKYEVIFDCLKCTFGLMVSNSRLIEQVHAMGRNSSVNSSQNFAFLDAKRCYMVNILYYMREERRILARKQNKNRLEDGHRNKKKCNRPPKVKHNHTHELQILEAQQVLDQARTYSASMIAKLPSSVQKSISTKNIRKRGFLCDDKDMLKMKLEYDEKKQRGRKRKLLDIEKHNDHARNIDVNNDVTFTPMSPEELERRKKLKSIATISFWDPGMSASMVKEKLPDTMPLFWKEDMKLYARKKLKPLLSEYITKVKQIANGDVSNTISKVPIPADQSYIDNLGMFINFSDDNVKHLYSDIEQKEMKHAQYRETIWKSCGCAIVDRNRYKLDR